MDTEFQYNRIIVPVKVKNIENLKELIRRIPVSVPIIEVWLDPLFEDYKALQTSKTLHQLILDAASHGQKLLGVCKTKKEQGAFCGSDTEKIEILQSFIQCGGSMVDVDVMRYTPNIIRKLPSENLVLSYHDFASYGENIREIYKTMQSFSPNIYKFAVTANTPKEKDCFLNFVDEVYKNIRGIFTLMGPYGEEGRKTIGKKSWAHFVALDGENRTAQGQIVLSQT